MCYECQGIDQTIGHYRQLERLTTDRQTLDSIHILIAKLQSDKKTLHPGTTPAAEPRLHPRRFWRRKIAEPLLNEPLPNANG